MKNSDDLLYYIVANRNNLNIEEIAKFLASDGVSLS